MSAEFEHHYSNALVAAQYVIIPMEPKPFNYTGLVDMSETIKTVQERYNPDLRVLGILLVKFNKRTNLTKLMQESIDKYAKNLDTTIFKTTIRDGIAVPESQLAQKPLTLYAPTAKPTLDYYDFAKEVISRMEDL